MFSILDVVDLKTLKEYLSKRDLKFDKYTLLEDFVVAIDTAIFSCLRDGREREGMISRFTEVLSSYTVPEEKVVIPRKKKIKYVNPLALERSGFQEGN